MSIKRAKRIEPRQLDLMLRYLAGSRTEERDKVFILLSCKAGLRAREIALLKWSGVTNAEGEIIREIRIDSETTKGSRERTIPMNTMLFDALCVLRRIRPDDERIAYSVKRGYKYMSPNAMAQYFGRYYRQLGFEGLSSHSGRRSFCTAAARQCNIVGASLVDVQRMAGHARLQTTAGYIDYSDQSVDLVELI